MISIDGSLFIQIANFLVIIFILNMLVYKPIRTVLLQRKEKIGSLKKGIDSLVSKAREKDKAFSAGIKSARAKGLKEKEILIGDAEAQEKAIIQKINSQTRENIISVKEKIAVDTKQVSASLIQQTDEFADIITEKILGRKVS
jgi:F-type H+-transporting ATPase subunit b